MANSLKRDALTLIVMFIVSTLEYFDHGLKAITRTLDLKMINTFSISNLRMLECFVGL